MGTSFMNSRNSVVEGFGVVVAAAQLRVLRAFEHAARELDLLARAPFRVERRVVSRPRSAL